MPTETVFGSATSSALRRRAEVQAGITEYQKLADLSPAEVERLIHELRVHQIELEMQNDELWRMQVELETSRTRYFDLYKLAPVGYLTLSEKGLILEANLRAAALLGIPSETLVKRPLGRFVHPDDADAYYHCMRLLWQTGRPQMCEVRLAPRGAVPPITWVQLEAVQAQDDEQQAAVCRVALVDLTERKRVEEALRASEERYRLLMMLSPDGISVADQSGRILACNEQFAAMHGFDNSAEVVGRNAQELASPEAFAELHRAVAAAFEKGERVVREIEVEALRRDGSRFPTEYSIAPVPWPEAPFGVAYLSNIRDITWRKEVAAELDELPAHDAEPGPT